ncbi:MAG: Na+/H+ antiporter subunit E [Ignavibacteria bacterium]|nr:Na+/H+ antiporter subunit E [Ignavibacteria bacterium]
MQSTINNKLSYFKRKLFFNALYSLIFASIWVILSSELTFYNYILGYIISYFILLYVGSIAFPLVDKHKDKSFLKKYTTILFILISRVWKAIVLFFYFLFELIKANFIVTFEILTPNFYMKPAVIAYPLDLKTDFQISILANFLTLTPGSLTIDVSPDKKFMYIHSMYVKDVDKFISHLKNGLEKRILDIYI